MTPKRRLSAAVITMAMASASLAYADITKDQCVDANAKGQDLRRDGKLAQAREQLRRCSDAACPAIVRSDCTKRLDDLESAQPSIVFDVKDPSGADVFDVKVSMDGQPLADRLDGKPIDVDPGPHTFTFESAGKPPVTGKLLIKEGEARRHTRVIVGGGEAPPPAPTAPPQVAPAVPTATAPTTVAPPPPPLAPPPPTAPTQPAPPPAAAGPGALSGLQVLGVVVGGAGVVGVGLGAYLGLSAQSAWSKAKSDCGGDPSNCFDVSAADSDHDTAVSNGTLATVSFVTGGVLLVTGVVLLATGGGHAAPASPTAGLTWIPTFGPGGAGVQGAF